MENKIIKVIDEQGNLKDAEVILSFESNEKKYVIYTFNEKDENESIILHSSVVKESNGEISFEKIEDEEWTMVKEIMNKIVKDWKEN